MSTTPQFKWQDHHATTALVLCAEYLRSELHRLPARLSIEFGSEVSYDAMAGAFRRRGWDSPGTFAKDASARPTGDTDRAPVAATAAALDAAEKDWTTRGADVSGLEWEDEAETIVNRPTPVAPLPDRLWVDRSPARASSPDDNIERVALIPDCHIPDQDPVAFPLALRAIEAFKPHTLVILGDFGEFASVSSHGLSAAKQERLKADFDAVNEQLDVVDAMAARCGVTRKIYCRGNHLFRVERYIADRCPELYGMVSAEQAMGFERRGWEDVRYRDFAKVGRLHVTHDCGHAGALAAAKSRDSYAGNIVVGHAHSANISYRGNARGEAHVGMCAGWLGDRTKISYMPKIDTLRNWQHGFGIAYVERDTGNCHVHFVPVVEGRCVVEGRVVT